MFEFLRKLFKKEPKECCMRCINIGLDKCLDLECDCHKPGF